MLSKLPGNTFRAAPLWAWPKCIPHGEICAAHPTISPKHRSGIATPKTLPECIETLTIQDENDDSRSQVHSNTETQAPRCDADLTKRPSSSQTWFFATRACATERPLRLSSLDLERTGTRGPGWFTLEAFHAFRNMEFALGLRLLPKCLQYIAGSSSCNWHGSRRL